MKKHLKIGLLLVLVGLFGLLSAQSEYYNQYEFKGESYETSAECFKKMEDVFGGIIEPPSLQKKENIDSQHWYEPEVMILYDEQGVPKFRYSKTFNIYGDVLTEVVEGYFNDSWVMGNRRSFVYDGSRNWLTILNEVWNGRSWDNYFWFESTYNSGNKMLTQLQREWKDEKWNDVLRWTNTYDYNGNILTQLYERPDIAGVWTNSSRWTWTYDGNNKELSEKCEDWYKGNWAEKLYFERTFDSEGNMLTEQFTKDKVLTHRYTMTYDVLGNMLTKLSENYKDGKWENHWRNIWTSYDASGNWLVQLFEAFENEDWISDKNTRGIRTYDKNGDMLTHLNEVFKGGKYINEYKLTNSYDENRNKLVFINELWNGVEWLGSWKESFTYDNSNNKLTELCEMNYSVTSADLVWVTNWDYLWEYDDIGNCVAVKADVKPSKETFSVYYNNMESKWPCPLYEIFAIDSEYGNVKDNIPVTGINLNINSLKMELEETFRFNATLNPEDASCQELRWMSTNEKVLTVDKEGVAKAISKGKADIIATSLDGAYKAICNVDVSTTSVNDLKGVIVNVFFNGNKIVVRSDIDITKVNVFDINGRIVYEGNNLSSIETSLWNDGVYIVKCMDDRNKVFINKVVVY